MSDSAEPTVFAGSASGLGAGRRPGRDATLVAGDLLNGIYKVERFIARGGMGEVFEGVNIETEERVAIKAIRSHLASDPKVVALFRKEARVLTQFAHPAIVQYRVFARDPLINLHYIVTDFIDGEPITAHLDGAVRDIRDVVILARRLATGLDVAHDHGAIHRDMSPDNVLLPHGKLDRAKIIDFGIAKSLDLVMETVVGDGFAGKLGYVAPEQFGDFGREVGPWTDVYSTALVLLAFARGKAPGMGTTLSEAVERRRLGPAQIDLPPALAPLIERMLVPDPAMRIRSMRDVLDGLDSVCLPDTPAIVVKTVPAAGPVVLPGPRQTPARDGEGVRGAKHPMTTFVPAPAPAPAPGDAMTEPTDGQGAARDTQSRTPVYNGAPSSTEAQAAVKATVPVARATKPAYEVGGEPRNGRRRWALLAAPIAFATIAGGYAVLRAPEPLAVAPVQAVRHGDATTPIATPRLPSADQATKIEALFATTPCTWVTARPTTESGTTILSGASGDTGALGATLAGARKLGPVEAKEILQATIAQCALIDLFRPFAAAGTAKTGESLFLSSSRISLGTGGATCVDGTTVEVTVRADDPARDFALLSLQSDGLLLQIAKSRAEFVRLARRNVARYDVDADGAYHASICYTLTGPAAIFMVGSKTRLDTGLRTGVATLPTPELLQHLVKQAGAAEVRTSADWTMIGKGAPTGTPLLPTAGVERPPPRTDAPDRPNRPLTSRDLIRLRSNTDVANANRQELDRLKPFQTSTANDGSSPCRVFGKSWKTIGWFVRRECISQGFERDCSATFVTYKGFLLRRQGQIIQEQRGKRWRSVAKVKPC